MKKAQSVYTVNVFEAEENARCRMPGRAPKAYDNRFPVIFPDDELLRRKVLSSNEMHPHHVKVTVSIVFTQRIRGSIQNAVSFL